MGKYLVTNSEEYGVLRIITDDHRIYLSAMDVARSLGYKRPSDAVRNHCPGAMKLMVPIPDFGGMELTSFIPEEEAIEFVDSCHLPGAYDYHDFLRSELPFIKKEVLPRCPEEPDKENETPETRENTLQKQVEDIVRSILASAIREQG